MLGCPQPNEHVRISCYKSESKYMCQPHEGTVGSVYVRLIVTFEIIITLNSNLILCGIEVQWIVLTFIHGTLTWFQFYWTLELWRLPIHNHVISICNMADTDSKITMFGDFCWINGLIYFYSIKQLDLWNTDVLKYP